MSLAPMDWCFGIALASPPKRIWIWRRRVRLSGRWMTGEGKLAYIVAIQAGLDKDYVPMERLFEQIIEESGRSS